MRNILKYLGMIACMLLIKLGNGQSKSKHELGVNGVGLIVKDQPSISSSVFYRYNLNKIQLRAQLIGEDKTIRKDRNGTFTQGGSFGSFTLDSSLKYNPGTNRKFR